MCEGAGLRPEPAHAKRSLSVRASPISGISGVGASSAERSPDFAGTKEKVEARVGCKVLNRMTAL